MTGRGVRSEQRGLGLIAAIAILVILAALGGFILTVTVFRDQSQSVDILGTRALHAARAGVDWYMYRIQNPEDTANPARFDCTGSAAVNLTGFGGVLSPFTVTVTCGTAKFSEHGADVWVHTITAVACNIPDAGACPNNQPTNTNPSYVERKIRASTETCRLSGAVCS